VKIAIVSDLHDNLPNFDKFLAFVRKEQIKTLLLCGDTGNKGTLSYITNNFDGEIYLVLGNMDQKIQAPDFVTLEIDKVKIAITHFPDVAKKLAESQKFDFVFYGHTHKPWIEETGKCFLANPGNLAGQFYKATFAVLDTKTKYLSLKILDNL